MNMRYTMIKEKLLELINTILINKNKQSIESPSNELSLRDDLGFDSLDLAELTVRIESEFGIDIFEDSIVLTIEEVLNKLKNVNAE